MVSCEVLEQGEEVIKNTYVLPGIKYGVLFDKSNLFQALVYRYNGRVKFVQGPKRVRLLLLIINDKIKLMTVFF